MGNERYRQKFSKMGGYSILLKNTRMFSQLIKKIIVLKYGTHFYTIPGDNKSIIHDNILERIEIEKWNWVRQ